MPKRPILPPNVLSAESEKLFEVFNSESDLACALVATSFLDAALRTLLHQHFRRSSVSDKLLKVGGALGEFSARADTAYALNLIEKGQYQDLQVIASIRNQFAHHHLELTFDSPEVKAECERLGSIINVPMPPESGAKTLGEFLGGSRRSPRIRFVLTVSFLAPRLVMRGLRAEMDGEATTEVATGARED